MTKVGTATSREVIPQIEFVRSAFRAGMRTPSSLCQVVITVVVQCHGDPGKAELHCCDRCRQSVKPSRARDDGQKQRDGDAERLRNRERERESGVQRNAFPFWPKATCLGTYDGVIAGASEKSVSLVAGVVGLRLLFESLT